MILHVSFWGHRFTQFPLALTQLVALEVLDARDNDFAELPAGITALSRLRALMLGRIVCGDLEQQLHDMRPLDVRALGDLSAFPVLRELSFDCCEVMVCTSVLGAVRHASLATLSFQYAHPAPECALAVLQLSQALKRLKRGRVFRIVDSLIIRDSLAGQALPPFYKFVAGLEAYEP